MQQPIRKGIRLLHFLYQSKTTQHPGYSGRSGHSGRFGHSGRSERQTEQPDEEGRNPCDRALPEDNAERPSAAELPLD